LPPLSPHCYDRLLLLAMEVGGEYAVWKTGIYWSRSPPPMSAELCVMIDPEAGHVDLVVGNVPREAGAAFYTFTQLIQHWICLVLGSPEQVRSSVYLPNGCQVDCPSLIDLALRGLTTFRDAVDGQHDMRDLLPDITLPSLTQYTAKECAEGDWEEISSGSQASISKGELNGQVVIRKRFLVGEVKEAPRPGHKAEALLTMLREAWSMIWTQHPSFIHVLGVCVSDVSLIAEYAPHGDLYGLLYHKKEIVMSWRYALCAALNIAQGLRHLHSLCPPLVHRDLKSPNILLMSVDQESVNPITAKIADLGLTCMEPTATSTLQADNPAWLAPEVMQGYPTTTKADVYSFGIVMYEILTRKFPFEEFDFKFQFEQVDAISKQHVRPTIPSAMPPILSELLKACWHPNPNSRPSFAEIVPLLVQAEKDIDTFPTLDSLL